jgi:uncharacterized membrane protein YeaQ/YmgE (transglycosylase-associated protein family)
MRYDRPKRATPPESNAGDGSMEQRSKRRWEMGSVFAEIALFPGGIIAWALVGLIGALVGGFLLSYFVQETAGFWGSIFVAFLGTCIPIAIVRAIAGCPAV